MIGQDHQPHLHGPFDVSNTNAITAETSQKANEPYSSLGKRKRSPEASTGDKDRSSSISTRPNPFDPVRHSIVTSFDNADVSKSLQKAPQHYRSDIEDRPLSPGHRTEQQHTSDQSSEPDSPDGNRHANTSPGHHGVPAACDDDSLAGNASGRKKRQFARRTKTGCITCRKRKKKCDEGRPFCDNCTRGKFACGGYRDRKSSLDDDRHEYVTKKPIQVRTRSDPPLIIDTNRLSISTSGPVHDQSHSTVDRRASGPWLAYGDGRTSMDTSRSCRMPGRDTRQDWTMPIWSPIGPSPPTQSLPQLHPLEHDRAGPRQEGYPAAEPQNPSRLERSTSGSKFVGTDEQEARERNNSARTILSMPRLSRSLSSQPRLLSEKDKMLSGQPYSHFTDISLRQERAACALLLDRFNEAARISHYSELERNAHLLRAVVAPLELQRRSDLRHSLGSVGRGVLIEAPFQCHYGYNIHIDDDVVIQTGCVMLDPCRISIGARTVVGPQVKFYGMGMSLDPKLRGGGSRSQAVGGSIVVETDCFIGGDVIIMSNTRIGRGSVVGAGTVVTKDVQPDTVVAGSPMRVLRSSIGSEPGADLDGSRTDDKRASLGRII